MTGKSALKGFFLFVLAVALVFGAAITISEAAAATTGGKPQPSEPYSPSDQGAPLRAAPRDLGERAPLAPGATLAVPDPYTTIQAAIDAAVTGDIITVAAGTYPEAIKIDGKDLTITGAGAGSTFITGDALNTTYIVYITGTAAVDFSGFTVDGSGKDIRYGVHADAYTDGDIHDNVIMNIVYPSALGLAVRRDDSYIDVTDNEIYGFGRIGIYTKDENILNTDTGVISGNTVTGLGGSDPARLSYGISVYWGNPTVTGNHVYDCNSGANVAQWASAGMDIWNGSSSTVSNNDIHDCDKGILVANSAITMSGNTFSGIISDEVRLDYMVKGNPTAHWAEWYDNIQDAVDAVPVTTYKSLVWVAIYSGSGTYEEQVVIDKNLRMYGNYSNTVIVSPVALTDYFVTGSNSNYPIVYVHDADDVVIYGLVVDGAGRGNSNNRFIGIGYRNAGGVVYAVDFLDVRDTPFSGAQHGVAMYLYNDDGAARGFYLGNCTFSGFQKNAVALNASATTALEVDVVGNTITGAGATDVTAQNGIQVWASMGSGTIEENVISGIAYDNTDNPIKYVASSILNYYSDLEILGNDVSAGHMCVYNYGGPALISGNTVAVEKAGVTGNGIYATDPPEAVPSPFGEEALLGSGRPLLGAPLGTIKVYVLDNTVTFSGGDNTGTIGIRTFAGITADDLDVTVNGNSVTGFDYGIVFSQSSTSTGIYESIVANYNSISGNTGYGMYSNAAYITADGSYNWWGHTSGPYHPTLNSDGLGSAVSDYILFEPFVQPAISVVPEYAITKCWDALTYEFIYDGTGVPDELRGFEITFSVDPAVTTLAALTDIVEGGFLGSFGSTQFFTSDEGGGVYKVSCAIYGGTTGATGTGTLFSVLLTPVAEGTSAIDITNVKLRDVDNAPISASISGGTIQVDCTPPTMKAIVELQGEWYNTAPTFSVFGFDDDVNLDLAEYQIDTGGWVTIFSGIDTTQWNDHGWALPGFGGLSEGSHTVYFRVKDDAGNSNGEGTPDTYSWQFYKDTEPPAHPTDFVALPGHQKVHLTWTNPSGDATFAGVEIRRVAWGDYPQYGTGTPIVTAPLYPADESEGALVVKADLTAYDDPIVPRDIYYYAAFAYDLAGNYSVFHVAAADRSTNYWLGDIASPYDGYVNWDDLIPFSNAFGSIQGGSGWDAEADFGPTDDWSRFGIPLPDDAVDFEDLMIFSMNYGHVDPLGFDAEQKTFAAEDLKGLVGFALLPTLTDEGVVYSLMMTSEARTLKGASVLIRAEGATVSAGRGEMLAGSGEVFFGVIERGGTFEICVAALGIDRPLAGSGEIARLLVRGEAGAIAIAGVDLRDIENTRYELEAGAEMEVPALPEATALRGSYPNPFNPATTVAFDLAKSGAVSIRIYDVSGRLVQVLVEKVMQAGVYDVTWDGRNAAGTQVPSGIYFCRMHTAGYTATSKMILLR